MNKNKTKDPVYGAQGSNMGVSIANDELLTRTDLVLKLKIHRNTLSKWLKEQRLPAPLLIAGQERWPASLINAWILQHNPQLQQSVQQHSVIAAAAAAAIAHLQG